MVVHYICDGCNQRILPGSARFLCLVCDDYDSCSSCHSSGRRSRSHQPSHQTHTLYPGLSTALPKPRINPTDPTTDRPNLRGKPKPNITPRVSPPPTCSPCLKPPPPSAPTPSQTPESYWGFISTPSGTPSSMFTRLFDAIFTHLESLEHLPRTGMIDPERLWHMYELMGYEDSRNTPKWIQQKILDMGATFDHADSNLAFIYRELGYEHVMTTRYPIGTRNGMPVLTMTGFAKLLYDEIIDNPDNAGMCLNTMLRLIPRLVDVSTGEVFLYREVPRSCLPREPDMVYRAKRERVDKELIRMQDGLAAELAAQQCKTN